MNRREREALDKWITTGPDHGENCPWCKGTEFIPDGIDDAELVLCDDHFRVVAEVPE